MGSSMPGEYHWPHIANDVYMSVRYCWERVQNRFFHKRQSPLQLCLANGPLKFVTMDSLGLLSRMLDCSQFVLVITDWYSKLSRVLLTCKEKDFAYLVNVHGRLGNPVLNPGTWSDRLLNLVYQ